MPEQAPQLNPDEMMQGATDVARGMVDVNTPPKPHVEINKQIDQYMADSAKRSGPQGIDNGFHSYQRIKGGDITRVANHGNPRKGVTRVMEVKGNVGNDHLSSEITTFGFEAGSEVGHVESARTSDGRSTHSFDPYGPNGYAGVSRKTENGNYVHRFKDPAKIRKASEHIASLASKRASKIVESDRANPRTSD